MLAEDYMWATADWLGPEASCPPFMHRTTTTRSRGRWGTGTSTKLKHPDNIAPKEPSVRAFFRFVGPTKAKAEAGHTRQCIHVCAESERLAHVAWPKSKHTWRTLPSGIVQHASHVIQRVPGSIPTFLGRHRGGNRSAHKAEAAS